MVYSLEVVDLLVGFGPEQTSSLHLFFANPHRKSKRDLFALWVKGNRELSSQAVCGPKFFEVGWLLSLSR